MTITLHDLYYIMGLNVERDPIKSWSKSDILATTSELFNISEYDADCRWDSRMLEYDYVQDPNVDITSSSRTATYLMWVVQNSIALDSSGWRPRSLIAPSVYNVWEIGKYAWRAVALAFLYRELGKASRPDAKENKEGRGNLLHIWVSYLFNTFLWILM